MARGSLQFLRRPLPSSHLVSDLVQALPDLLHQTIGRPWSLATHSSFNGCVHTHTHTRWKWTNGWTSKKVGIHVYQPLVRWCLSGFLSDAKKHKVYMLPVSGPVTMMRSMLSVAIPFHYFAQPGKHAITHAFHSFTCLEPCSKYVVPTAGCFDQTSFKFNLWERK